MPNPPFSIETILKKHKPKINGLIHAGANLGQEALIYRKYGISNVHWIEAVPEVVAQLRRLVERYEHKVHQAVLSDVSGQEIEFNIAKRSDGSSIFPIMNKSKHSFKKAIKLTTSTLDDLDIDGNFLVLDLQGAELLALKGATETLKRIDYIFTEIWGLELYDGCGLFQETIDYLVDFNLIRFEFFKWGWGDAYFERKRNG